LLAYILLTMASATPTNITSNKYRYFTKGLVQYTKIIIIIIKLDQKTIPQFECL